jgi:L-ribulose-5-phosphate 4-epimerase
MAYDRLIFEMLAAARRIDRRNLQTNNGGNFSARAGDGIMLIKASEVSFSTAVGTDIVPADFCGAALSARTPSREGVLHGAIYRAFPQVRAIMHCHSPWATAWAESMLPLAHATHHAPLKLGEVVPVFDTSSYAVSAESTAGIITALEEMASFPKAFLLRRHGVVAMDTTMEKAANIAELVEETAQIAILTRLCGF